MHNDNDVIIFGIFFYLFGCSNNSAGDRNAEKYLGVATENSSLQMYIKFKKRFIHSSPPFHLHFFIHSCFQRK